MYNFIIYTITCEFFHCNVILFEISNIEKVLHENENFIILWSIESVEFFQIMHIKLYIKISYISSISIVLVGKKHTKMISQMVVLSSISKGFTAL